GNVLFFSQDHKVLGDIPINLAASSMFKPTLTLAARKVIFTLSLLTVNTFYYSLTRMSTLFTVLLFFFAIWWYNNFGKENYMSDLGNKEVFSKNLRHYI